MILEIIDQVFVFRSDEDRISDSLLATVRFGRGADQHIERQIYVTKDLNKGKIIRNFRTRFSDFYDVKIENNPVWEVKSDTRRIEELNVQKAVTSYGGREWTAWFAPEIPVSDGPYIFHGLPGLIVKVTDTDRDYDFTLVAIKNTSGNLFMRKKGLEMNFSEFKKLMMQYYNDPYADLKLRNMLPVYTSDGHGGKKPVDLNELTKQTRRMIPEQNNPIEKECRNDYR